MVNFSTWIFDHFPYFFRENDTYKDGGGKGLFQRYLQALGEELDEEVVSRVPGIFNLYDADVVGSKQLGHLAELLGNPPDTFGNSAMYRKLLKYIVKINKYKGTPRGYELMFGVLGVQVTVTDEPLREYRYDSGNNYDTPDLRYNGNCPPCSKYTLTILDPANNCPEIGQALTDPILLDLLTQIIKYVEPINAVLLAITYNGIVTEGNWVLTTGIWADQHYWNDAKYWRDTP